MSAAPLGARPIRTAVVGLGWAARSIWLPRLSRHPAFTVNAAVDPDPASRAAVAADHAGTPLLAAVHDVDPAQADLAVVAVPNHLHCEIASSLLLKGVPVFLEKPVCLTSAEAEQLAEAERVGGARLLAGSAARHRADIGMLLASVAELGDVRHVELSWVRARGVPDAGGWFTRRRLSGGGALLDLGWHLFDIAAPLLGSADFAQVTGAVSGDFIAQAGARVSWRAEEEAGQSGRAASVPPDVEDTARAFLVTEDGISLSLHASWASHEELDVTRVRVDGSAGSATLRCTFGFSPNRLARPELTLTRDGGTRTVPVPEEPIGTEYDRQLDELSTRLRDPSGPGRAIEEVRRTIGAIERVYASARAARKTSQPTRA
ncbi:gfo/Idh/MocA family oxidoreductase [Streptomyces dangxiongensis]|uniref:Gfo/Idh/MocA family oxidoreductase n=1 Tax=Streptomyces dangxiongensis TaxID=1442032 RepID=A0A3G2JA96_9ACTN|nr:Gfo/Idh/MocA family oxidoreductase [Streptomyces dangxiongensis]AYN38345.1 gfo/Idh/MocA family oxidoreductase [Streptomyces dangxiongensis]